MVPRVHRDDRDGRRTRAVRQRAPAAGHQRQRKLGERVFLDQGRAPGRGRAVASLYGGDAHDRGAGTGQAARHLARRLQRIGQWACAELASRAWVSVGVGAVRSEHQHVALAIWLAPAFGAAGPRAAHAHAALHARPRRESSRIGSLPNRCDIRECAGRGVSASKWRHAPCGQRWPDVPIGLQPRWTRYLQSTPDTITFSCTDRSRSRRLHNRSLRRRK